ncbi:MAG: 16S rRNA (guanine(527)-N(7))-methyltransferase RsmG [Eubacteriales bacterium]|nr:16S rRNA (guanine(527)-N(7))-methyltransferase RsmG [Eubacteriales bacterium]
MTPDELRFIQTLQDKLLAWNQPLSAATLSKMAAFYYHMVQTNKVMNLTGITDATEAALRHFADALNPAAYAALPAGARVVDVGTGAGFPGMPLAIARPDCTFLLIDSMAKRIGFLQDATARLGLNNVSTAVARAEDLGRGAGRGRFDVALSRAVAPLNVLLEYALPLLKTGGKALCYKGPAGVAEAAQAGEACRILGGDTPQATPYELQEDLTLFVISIKKIRQTPAKYPRKTGIPQKTPL